jgi:hypothetical protein
MTVVAILVGAMRRFHDVPRLHRVTTDTELLCHFSFIDPHFLYHLFCAWFST